MNYNYKKLPNGLQVLMDYMPQIESASIRILFNVGSKDEDCEIAKNGISHLIEHMNFKGTIKRSAKEIAEEFDMIGGYLNAYTSKERTVYYAKVLKNDLTTAIDILSDILINSIHEQKELDREKNVIKQEISDAKDDPEDVLFEALWNRAFSNHQLGKPIAGTHESVDNTSRDDLIKYLDHFYNPKNTIIAISGNFDETEVLQNIEEKFTVWKNKCEDVTHNDKKPEYIGGDIRVNKEIEQAHIALCFNGVSYCDSDYYLYQVAALVAGGSMSSRLFQEVREKLGLAYNISAFCASYKNCGLWGVYASTDPDSVNQLIEITIKTLYQISRDASEKEVISAKAQIKSSLLMSQESSSSRASKLVNNYSSFGRVISNEEIITKIDAIDHLMVRQCISKLLLSINEDTLTFATAGNIEHVMPYEQIVKQIEDLDV